MVTTLASSDLERTVAERIAPDQFEASRHYYPKAAAAAIHPLVSYFLHLSPERIVERTCHLYPHIDRGVLEALLRTHTKHLAWAGADLFYTVTDSGVRRMVLIETNSCPSGNKSMPALDEHDEEGGYRRMLAQAFAPLLKRRNLPVGELAVVYDKNYIEAAGYAASLANLTGEHVWLASWGDGAADPPVRIDDGVLHIRDPDQQWRPIRAALRYVTKRPWNRIPVRMRTALLNPVVGCLAGGRNKLVAAKAYDLMNAELTDTGLQIRTPETIWNVSRESVPMWVQRFGGYAVVKNPYSNAGQGVWTLTNAQDLQCFMDSEHAYNRFLVQALVGNSGWTSRREGSRYYHVGTMPNKRGEIFVADIRVMVASGPDGFRPVALYARRAAKPLSAQLDRAADSWQMLGTNLSVKREDGGWDADISRLLIMDRKDFNLLGLGPDDLLEAYLQTVLSVIAIDRMASSLLTKKGNLRHKLFHSLNDDSNVSEEILPQPSMT